MPLFIASEFLESIRRSVIRRIAFSSWIAADTSRLQNEVSRQEEPRVLVQSEDHPDRMLLETRICKEDGFQKQQGI
jgi:hypothetical protein